MRIRKQLIYLVITILLISCDRVAKIKVGIINTTNKQISVNYINRDLIKDTVQNVKVNSGDTAIILTTVSEVLGRNEMPRNILLGSDTFVLLKNIQVYIDSIPINKDFGLTKMWTYQVVNKNLGIYYLKIDSLAIQ